MMKKIVYIYILKKKQLFIDRMTTIIEKSSKKKHYMNEHVSRLN